MQTESRREFTTFILLGAVPARRGCGIPAPSSDCDDPAGIDAARRRKLFIVTLLPVVLDVNARIRLERDRLLSVVRRLEDGRPVTKYDRSCLSRLAQRYRTADPEELLRRVDEIPPSLAIAQAAVETGWGASPGAPTTLDPAAAIESYALDLNTNEAYRSFRGRRARQRATQDSLEGHSLAGTLEQYSAKGWDHVMIVRAVIRDNRMEALDRARLAPHETGIAQLAGG